MGGALQGGRRSGSQGPAAARQVEAGAHSKVPALGLALDVEPAGGRVRRDESDAEGGGSALGARLRRDGPDAWEVAACSARHTHCSEIRAFSVKLRSVQVRPER